MKKVSWILSLVLAGALVFADANPLAGKSSTPATATFRDASGDKIQSDGLGAYSNGIDCVNSTVGAGGSLFLRTVSLINNGRVICSTTTPRSIALNFTGGTLATGFSCTVPDLDDSGLSLNACGSNTLPDVRIITSSLFGSGSASVVLSFSLHVDFHETDFELDFLNPICVSGSGTTRVLEAGGTATCSANPTANAAAELYQNSELGKKTSVGMYTMPFQLTVTEQ